MLPASGDACGIGPSVVSHSLCAASLDWLVGQGRPDVVTWSFQLNY